MLRRILVDLAIALGFVASAVVLATAGVALLWMGRLAAHDSLAGRGGLVMLSLAVVIIVLGQVTQRLFPERRPARTHKTGRLAARTMAGNRQTLGYGDARLQ